MQIFQIYISETAEGLEDIPREYKDLYSLVPHADVLSLLETHDAKYVAVMTEKKGCVNSALLIEEIVGYMLSTYTGRLFSVKKHILLKLYWKRFSNIACKRIFDNCR